MAEGVMIVAGLFAGKILHICLSADRSFVRNAYWALRLLFTRC